MLIEKSGFGSCLVTSSLELMALWVQTLHGQGDQVAALGKLARLTKSNSAIMVRFKEDADYPQIISSAKPDAAETGANVSNRSFTRSLLANNLNISKPGVIWYLSEECGGEISAESTALSRNLQAQGIADIAIIALEVRAGVSDYLELHFAHSVTASDRKLLSVLAGTLSRSWRMRIPGTACRLIKNARNLKRADTGRLHSELILGADNPRMLSRSEYRVCLMVKDGLLAKDIAKELSIKESTVRSHLHSIYAKTSTSGHVGLLHRLIGGEEVETAAVGLSDSMRQHADDTVIRKSA